VVAIAEIDTRKLTRILREKGALNGCLMAGEINEQKTLAQAKSFPGLKGLDLAKEVSTPKIYPWTARPQKFHVVAYDFGIKRNILRLLAEYGCGITVVPAKTPAKEVLALKPDGIFLSNGPGDPEPCSYAVEAIREILTTNKPLFGICLGHQLLGLACGAKTVKMKFGHHGANHPVMNLKTGKVMISSQNHGFAIDEETLPNTLVATHRSLFDGSLQGVRHLDKPAFGFQGHPEASPGPHDGKGLFDQFVEMMRGYKS
jgi:carbamoyl-phosphate synthase small subunit